MGGTPSGVLLQASDGHLYGVTNAGGAWNRGVVYRLEVGLLAPTAVASGSATVCEGSPTLLSGSGGVSCSWSPVLGLDNPASCTPHASPASTTTYTLTVTDASGHLSINKPTVTVTVDSPPIAVASGSVTIGAGLPAPLTGSGGVACLWSPATGLDNPTSCSPNATPATTTTYALTITSAGGCVSTNDATVTVTVAAAGDRTPVNAGPTSGTIIAVNTGRGDQTDPHVDGDVMTYTDNQGASSQVRYYQFSTGVDQGVPLGQAGDLDLLSDVNRGRIPFSRVRTDGTTAIMLFDTTTPALMPTEIDPTPGSARFGAAIGADTIAFSDAASGDGDIVAWDLASAQAQVVGASPLLDEGPHVSPDGHAVVWARCPAAGCDVFEARRNGGAWTVSPVTSTRNSPGDADTDGTWIVYDADIPGSTGQDIYLTHIYLTPLAGGSEARLTLPGVQRTPHISRGVISFESTPAPGGNATSTSTSSRPTPSTR